MRVDAGIRVGVSIDATFRASVETAPDAVALISGDDEITRSELAAWSDAIGSRLLDAGLLRGQVVGVHLERGPGFVAACLGIMRAGGLYLPLEPSSPSERLAVMADDSGLTLVVTDRPVPPLSGFEGTTAIDVAPGDAVDPDWPELTPADEAFLVYTSGSTGRPKGVPLSHEAVLNRLEWQWRRFPYEPDEVAIQKTTSNFVDHAAELFAPLLAGIPVVIASEADSRDLWRFVDLIEAHQIRRTVLVPSIAGALLDAIPDAASRLSSIRWLTVSGERLLAPVAERIFDVLPDIELINIYGMSEAMADVTYNVVSADSVADAPLIGAPIDGMDIAVTDAVGGRVTEGETGEIRVSGPGLSSGYWNRPDLTAERFGPLGAAADGSQRWFATGDLGRLDPAGRLEYLGRADDQVKVRGVRIELGDVEAAVVRLAGVTEAAVVAVDRGSSTRIAAFVEADDEFSPTAARAELGDLLLSQAVPSSITVVDSLPRLASGKVDRRSLGDELEAGRQRDVAQDPMTQLWASMPDLDVHGPDDDFFECGGHSLLAVGLVAAINAAYDVELGLDALVSASTPRAMAERVALGSDTPLRHRVTWFPGLESTPSVHLVHGAGGNVMNFRPLAAALSPEVNVESYQARGVDGRASAHPSVDAMVTAYLAEYNADDSGPVVLGGYSGGGLIALEMAARLTEAGRRVDRVVLLDSRHPSARHRPLRAAQRARLIISERPSALLRRLRRRARDRTRRRQLDEARRFADREGVVPLPLVEAYLLDEIDGALARHDVRDPGVPVTMFRAESIDPSIAHVGETNGWTDEFADFEIVIVPGGHDCLLDPEWCDPIVEHLRQLVGVAP